VRRLYGYGRATARCPGLAVVFAPAPGSGLDIRCGGPIKLNSRLAHRIQPAVRRRRRRRRTLDADARGSVRSREPSRHPRVGPARGSEPGTGAPAGDAHTGASATADTMPKPPYSTLYYRASDIYRVHHLSPNTA